MSFIGAISHAAHDISGAAHAVVHGVKAGIHAVEGEADKLSAEARHELNSLKVQVSHLESHLQIAELVNKALHDAVHNVEDLGEDFAHGVKDAAEDVWDHVHEIFNSMLDLVKKITDGKVLLEILVELIQRFTDTTKDALRAIAHLFDKAEDIVKLIDLDRFKRVFEGIVSVWDELVHLAEQVPVLLGEAISLADSAKTWIDTAVIDKTKGQLLDKSEWIDSLQTFSKQFADLISSRTLPLAHKTLKIVIEELREVVSLVPDHFWPKAYHALHLHAIYDFIQYAIKAMKSPNFKRDMAIAIASAKAILHWIKTIPQVLGLDADFDLMDFIKAKVGAGDASGVAEGGGDGDSGGGFSLKFNAFSGMGALGSILGVIMNLFIAGGTLAVDLIKA